jgi:nucleotide-binding universal stress UspA family protein
MELEGNSLFKNILVPVSSGHYSKQIVYRSVQLAEYFKSTVTLLYIIDEKTIDQTERLTDSYRAYYDRLEAQQDLMRKQRLTATQIVFDFASHLFAQKGITFHHFIKSGEFSDVVLGEIQRNNYDFVIMGYEKECMLHYRLLDELTVPIWVEIQKTHEPRILGICTNLAPNQYDPTISKEISKALDWELLLYYIMDSRNLVTVGFDGVRLKEKLLDNLDKERQKFIEKIKKEHINIETVVGGLEQEIMRKARKYDPTLIIIGREQKRRGALGLPYGNIKRKLMQKCKYSLLFIN